jgi:hypothetical protein
VPAVAILVLGAIGAWRERERRPILTLTLGGTSLVIAAAAAYGVYVPGLRRFETARFAVALPLVLAPAAGVALRHGLDVLQQAIGRPLVVVGLVLACTLPPFLAALDARFFSVHRLDATLDPGFTELVQALDATTPREARLLFESTAGATTAISDGAVLQALLPLYLRRELAGAPRPGLSLRQARIDFGGGLLAATPFAQWSEADFAAFVQRYRVGAVAAWSPAARGFLARNGATLDRATSVRGFDVYRVRHPGTVVARGKARVRADYGRIEVDAIDGEIIDLRYHWMEGLHATPEIAIERWDDGVDPVGFLRLRPGGVDRVVIRSRR